MRVRPLPRHCQSLAQCLEHGRYSLHLCRRNESFCFNPEAGAISLATPPMTRGRLLGLSVSKFTCFKKKVTFWFLPRGLFLLSVGSAAGRLVGWRNGLCHRVRTRPGSVSDSPIPGHPTGSSSGFLVAILGHQTHYTYMKCQTRFAPKRERDCSFPTFL